MPSAAALAAALLALAGCHPGEAPPISAAFGAADDVKAAQVGRLALESGGNAVDAAVAMALTMAVTLPSRVGLGGGGLCLVHDPASKTVRALDFLPEPAAPGQPPAPTFLRGLYTLHAAYGRQHWEQALGGPESLAAVGVPVSHLLAADLSAAAGKLGADPVARRVYFSASGQPLAEGETLTQPDLASTLRTVRQRGVGAFYSGAVSGGLGATLAEGLGLSATALNATQAEWRPTLDFESDNNVIHLPERRHGGDAGLAGAWRAGVEADGGAWLGALVGALGPSAAGAAAPAASLAVVDLYEQAVACVFTLGGPFGSGRVVPELGVVAPGPAGGTGVGGPALMVNHHQGTTLFAGGASAGEVGAGGRGAEAALLSTLHLVAVDGVAGPQAVMSPRAAPAAGGGVMAESGVPAAWLGPLAPGARPAAAVGRVDAVACLYNRTKGVKACEAISDPRGSGVNFTVLK